ncbi:PREDICTED: serine-rich adhesin for platelets-like [Habropoda laboriosa]|uniref:serine-rich adhesin for platelets-like n=1 Tax=Habropoda laboriosa TaxID=597456 RepID=UPI00083D1C6D|nr:PREDICTED: serine-rich adhesin for platelets-like [Habropoda laboriosa]
MNEFSMEQLRKLSRLNTATIWGFLGMAIKQGVASIPDCKDQRACDEWNGLRTIRKMDVAKSAAEDFVTVVSVESQPPPENFVTVLSIGNSKKDDEPPTSVTVCKPQSNGIDGPLEEEVEVYRLPGERLGFGLKFEGGNKTSERVRRLFVQSCAEQSPASRAKCSWGTLGEGDEVLSIDGVPVTHMTRLDCVRRLKESQLVIKLMVRCRGALRPEVVSAEKKSSPEKKKVPPELPSAPPPVPPRKLRQARGLADGEANPSPVKKSWNGSRSQSSSQSSSQNGSPSSQPNSQGDSKSTSFESCESSPKSVNGSVRQDSPKGSPKERSPELAKSKQEPPEAMVYMDARSQCGSTHGSTSDDTGSSMSTVIDRFSTSDRVSTISTTSTASTASEQPNEFSRIDQDFDRSSDRDSQLSKATFENLEDYSSNPPDYLLRRLASSEAVTHVESRGEVEKITAVVAPNTVLIEETITFQPPLSFQDAPLSYGHEARPDLFYTADLAADSTTHFRPIKDDVELVERVNSIHEEFRPRNSSPEPEKVKEASCGRGTDRTPPPLPARNHVNRISVNQPVNEPRSQKLSEQSSTESSDNQDAPVLPPKPLPRRDVKVRRKRPPPPPPPPPTITPRTEVKPSSLPESRQTSFEQEDDEPSPHTDLASNKLEEAATRAKLEDRSKTADRRDAEVNSTPLKNPCDEGVDLEKRKKKSEETDDTESMENYDLVEDDGQPRTNKVLEIIEIRMAKAFLPQRTNFVAKSEDEEVESKAKCMNDIGRMNGDSERVKVNAGNGSFKKQERPKPELRTAVTISAEIDESDEENEQVTKFNEPIDESSDTGSVRNESLDRPREVCSPVKTDIFGRRESEDREDCYRSHNDINRDMRSLNLNRGRNEDETMDEDDSSEESDEGDYYWQSNLATIGEEEETNSLEYMNANKEASDSDTNTAEKEERAESPGKKDTFNANARNDEVDSASRTANFNEAVAENLHAETVNGRMDNCGGGQRLPPDGDEFPAAYQEFGGGGGGSSSNGQQYRFVTANTTTPRTSTMIANGRLVCNENESFMNNESYKLLESNVVTATGIVLPDNNRVAALNNVESVCQEVNTKIGLPSIEINGKMSVENVCQEAREARVDDSKPYITDDLVKKAASVTNYSSYGNQGNGNIVVSEKKIEITGYYHKDVPVIEEVQQDHAEKDQLDTPPPLPLTGPPKMDAIGPTTTSYTKNSSAAEPTQRKFSLNGELLWRQDDKSERSVRDKIAMFSSQSSLDGPLFPNSVTVAAATSNGRRLSKYKSTEDVCSDEKSSGQKERSSFFADRTQSSFDLTDSGRNVDPGKKYRQRSPSITQSSPFSSPTIHTPKTFPIVPQKPVTSTATPLISSFENSSLPKSPVKNYPTTTTTGQSPPNVSLKPVAPTALSRATSFSGTIPYGQERTTTTTDLSAGPQITRTNSLASTFKRPAEDIRRTSLNQLIEQRRRSISKLRGLVIPEKEAISIDAPIVDLPEIKSRDSILLHQLPKANIQDKWGSQSSLASNASTASMPLKATTSFKMPAPQIHSKYSPAFKRKSLAVYGSSSSNSTINSGKNCPSAATTPTLSEPPKSLESICSPTRSDYSFEFASTASSPEGLRNRPKTVQRKTRMDYDDSDNDSAVSSSQSSISRGFSPPMSPVPSERSTVSSERSYLSTETNYQRRTLIMDSPTRTYNRESNSDFGGRSNMLGERTFTSERSSSSSSSSDLRSPTTESSSRNSQIPQRQLKRSNSTDTNCSTSSTLTSGSQASAESLSRRVLKPQSVEAINRKNILASARCRSGRDLNGSPLIQRKFPEEDCRSTLAENGDDSYQRGRVKDNVSNAQDVKIAYIEVTDAYGEDDGFQKEAEESKMSPKRNVRSSTFEIMEPSNDLKMWVRTEAKALARSAEEKTNKTEKKSADVDITPVRNNLKNNRTAIIEEQQELHSMELSPASRNVGNDNESGILDVSKQRNAPSIPAKKSPEDQNDLLTILTTKSRTRSAIHVDDGSFGRSKSQMSLEDILSAKADAKISRSQAGETRIEKNSVVSTLQSRSLWESRDSKYVRRSSSMLNESWSEDKSFSKIPTLGKSRLADSSGDETPEVEKSKSPLSKIPTTRNLNRRSASVTDMKKALEKMDVNCPASPHQTTGTTHNRFPSLDSSVDENVSTLGADMDADRCCSEQFGSISSLASSTSLISQQELAQLVEEASLEEARGAHDVIVVLLHKENPTGSVGITLAGGADCEIKEITVHRVLAHSIADKDGRVQRGDRILSINGRSTQGLTHRESIAVLKQPRSEVVLVVSRARTEEGCKLKSRTASVETIIEGFETNEAAEDTAWGPPSVVAVYKDGAGLGFSLEGGRDSPLGNRPLMIKKIFTGGAAEKTGALKAGDQLLEVNGYDVTRMSRIESWNHCKEIPVGPCH